MSALPGQVVRFAAVGAAGTGAYLGAFELVHALGPQAASLTARLVVALRTSWLHARVTFRSRAGLCRAYLAGLGGLALGAALSALALLALHAAEPRPSRGTELVVLALTQVAGAVLRFLLLRRATRSRPLPRVRRPHQGAQQGLGRRTAGPHAVRTPSTSYDADPASSLRTRSAP